MSGDLINLAELREKADRVAREALERSVPGDPLTPGVILAPPVLLALVDAVEAARIAVPISRCDLDICGDGMFGCSTESGACARIEAMDELSRFDFGDAR